MPNFNGNCTPATRDIIIIVRFFNYFRLSLISLKTKSPVQFKLQTGCRQLSELQKFSIHSAECSLMRAVSFHTLSEDFCPYVKIPLISRGEYKEQFELFQTPSHAIHNKRYHFKEVGYINDRTSVIRGRTISYENLYINERVKYLELQQ